MQSMDDQGYPSQSMDDDEDELSMTRKLLQQQNRKRNKSGGFQSMGKCCSRRLEAQLVVVGNNQWHSCKMISYTIMTVILVVSKSVH